MQILKIRVKNCQKSSPENQKHQTGIFPASIIKKSSPRAHKQIKS